MSFGSTVHPTETAGDGARIETSPYVKPPELMDDYVSCSQCGFQVNRRIRSQADSLGAVGSPTLKTQTFTPPRGTSQSDTFGDPVDTGSGCPLCNSLNFEGRGRDTWGENSINLEGF